MKNYLFSKNQEKGLNPAKPMFPIGIIAEYLSLTPKTLRYYEQNSILVPAKTSKNRKLYSINDLDKGTFIKYLSTEAGVNIAGIRIILSLLKALGVKPDNYAEYIKELMGSFSENTE